MAEYTLHCFAQSSSAYEVAPALELAGAALTSYTTATCPALCEWLARIAAATPLATPVFAAARTTASGGSVRLQPCR